MLRLVPNNSSSRATYNIRFQPRPKYARPHVQTYKRTNVQTYKPTNLQTYKPTSLQAYKATKLQSYKATNLQTYKPTNVQTYKPTDTCACVRESPRVCVCDHCADSGAYRCDRSWKCSRPMFVSASAKSPPYSMTHSCLCASLGAVGATCRAGCVSCRCLSLSQGNAVGRFFSLCGRRKCRVVRAFM